MAQLCGPHASPRHGFAFNHVPTRRVSTFGGSVTVHYPEEYGAILDCVYEMADQVACSNSVHIDDAIGQVLKDEKWTLLPTHRTLIKNRLADDRLEVIFSECCENTT